MGECHAYQVSDSTICPRCKIMWDTNDPHPPACPVLEIEVLDMAESVDKPKRLMSLLKWALLSAAITAALVLYPLMQPATDEEILCVMQGHCPKGWNK